MDRTATTTKTTSSLLVLKALWLSLLWLTMVEGFSREGPSRRDFLTTSTVTTASAAIALFPSMAEASSKMPPDVALERIEYELNNANGGFAYMDRQLKEENFPALLEFTKTYDQNLRKTAMGGLKTSIQNKEQATELANAVTFDLIGINRSSRPGQENIQAAQKYYQELVQDVNEFLSLARTE